METIRIDRIRAYLLNGYALNGYVLVGYVLNGYVLNGYVLVGYVLVGYVLNGYVWDMCGVRYPNNLLKNPATKRLSGKNETNFSNPYILEETLLPFRIVYLDFARKHTGS